MKNERWRPCIWDTYAAFGDNKSYISHLIHIPNYNKPLTLMNWKVAMGGSRFM
jgi:hypothetical protein